MGHGAWGMVNGLSFNLLTFNPLNNNHSPIPHHPTHAQGNSYNLRQIIQLLRPTPLRLEASLR
jgi:hypothetical protein